MYLYTFIQFMDAKWIHFCKSILYSVPPNSGSLAKSAENISLEYSSSRLLIFLYYLLCLLVLIDKLACHVANINTGEFVSSGSVGFFSSSEPILFGYQSNSNQS